MSGASKPAPGDGVGIRGCVCQLHGGVCELGVDVDDGSAHRIVVDVVGDGDRRTGVDFGDGGVRRIVVDVGDDGGVREIVINVGDGGEALNHASCLVATESFAEFCVVSLHRRGLIHDVLAFGRLVM